MSKKNKKILSYYLPCYQMLYDTEENNVNEYYGILGSMFNEELSNIKIKKINPESFSFSNKKSSKTKEEKHGEIL